MKSSKVLKIHILTIDSKSSMFLLVHIYLHKKVLSPACHVILQHIVVVWYLTSKEVENDLHTK